MSSAAGVPDTEVGSRRLDRLTFDLHEALFRGVVSTSLQAFRSSCTHWDHVFLGLPRIPWPVTLNLVTELMHEEERIT